MPTKTAPDVELQSALRLVRHYRHQPDCLCFAYRGPDGEGFCTVDEARYNAKIDCLLDLVQ